MEIGESSIRFITSSLAPLPPTSPIFEIPKNQLYSEDFSKLDIEEEKAKLKVVKIEVWQI